jgi:hypothetical protein
MIPYIQPIFAADNILFKKNIDSIKSFGKYIQKYSFDVKCIFGGWAYNDEMWNNICEVIKKEIPNEILIEVVRYDKNYGKAYVVNGLYKKISSLEFQFFLTADSDIVFDSEVAFLFERLEDAAMGLASEGGNVKPFGYIGLQQTGQCTHRSSVYENETYVKNRFGDEELLAYPNSPSGIAGGCLFINRKLWEILGGYRVMGIYAGEDGRFLYEAVTKGYRCCVSTNISIIHPPSPNQEKYNKWKIQSALPKHVTQGKECGEEKLKSEAQKNIVMWDGPG